MENIKILDSCPCSVDLSISNLILPNFEYNGSIGDISLYVFESQKHLIAFKDNIGTITLQES